MIENYIERSERISKVCVIADRDVGKTALAKYMDSGPNERHIDVLGIDIFKKQINTFGILTSHMVWMVSPSRLYMSLLEIYLTDANGIILMYDITNADSLNYLSEVLQNVGIRYGRENLPILLVGNKFDLKKKREVSKEQIKKFKSEHNISKSMEISMKTGENVEKMFTRLTRITFNNIAFYPIPRIRPTAAILRMEKRGLSQKEYAKYAKQKNNKKLPKRTKSKDDLGLFGWVIALALFTLFRVVMGIILLFVNLFL